MGLAMLRTTQIQEKWKAKLSKAMDQETERGLGTSSRRYALFVLPLITVLREGLEAIVFIGGVTFTESAKAIPAAVIVGFFCGLLIGYILYRGGNKMNLHKFFTASTCLLLLLAAGLVAKGVASFESYAWNKATNARSDDSGSYDPRNNVWALNCCDPRANNQGFAQLMNALFGWNNIASIGTIVCYIGYWLVVVGALIYMKLKRRRQSVLDRLAEDSKENMFSEDVKVLKGEKELDTPSLSMVRLSDDVIRDNHIQTAPNNETIHE
ncbi:high-affinity iron permease [Entomortierella lignicola]|nr:high-affinity iron permease [Entomortierella lignicola]